MQPHALGSWGACVIGHCCLSNRDRAQRRRSVTWLAALCGGYWSYALTTVAAPCGAQGFEWPRQMMGKEGRNTAIEGDSDRIRATPVPECGAADPKAPCCGCACHETSEPLPAAADGRMAQPPWLPGTDRPAQPMVSRIFLRRNSKGVSVL